MQKMINEAEGKAQEIITIAEATAVSIKKIANVISQEGGKKAIKLQVAEKLFAKFNNLAKKGTRVIIPANMMDFNSWLHTMGLQMDGTE